jgi:hypothetical protein
VRKRRDWTEYLIDRCLALSADAERILISHNFQTIPEHFWKFTRD